MFQPGIAFSNNSKQSTSLIYSKVLQDSWLTAFIAVVIFLFSCNKLDREGQYTWYFTNSQTKKCSAISSSAFTVQSAGTYFPIHEVGQKQPKTEQMARV